MTGDAALAVRLAPRLAIGFALFLAVAEVVRNWGDWGYWPFWVVDYIAVALLLVGARLASRPAATRRMAPLAGAWGFTCAMFYGSFFSHLEMLSRQEADHGPVDHTALTVIIGVLFALTVVGFGLSLVARERA